MYIFFYKDVYPEKRSFLNIFCRSLFIINMQKQKMWFICGWFKGPKSVFITRQPHLSWYHIVNIWERVPWNISLSRANLEDSSDSREPKWFILTIIIMSVCRVSVEVFGCFTSEKKKGYCRIRGYLCYFSSHAYESAKNMPLELAYNWQMVGFSLFGAGVYRLDYRDWNRVKVQFTVMFAGPNGWMA